jgi:hypothetical protein
MKLARYEVPSQVRSAWNRQKIWLRRGGTVEIALPGKLWVPNFTPAPNQASLRDAAVFRTLSRQ